MSQPAGRGGAVAHVDGAGKGTGTPEGFRESGTSPPAYLTADEVAALLQVSPKTVYRWTRDDLTMPALRIGAVVRYPRDRILTWLRQREQGLGRAPRSRRPLLSDA